MVNGLSIDPEDHEDDILEAEAAARIHLLLTSEYSKLSVLKRTRVLEDVLSSYLKMLINREERERREAKVC